MKRSEKTLLLHLLHQGERIAAAHDDRFGLHDRPHGVCLAVYGPHPNIYLVETPLHLRGIFVIGEGNGGIRDEQHLVGATEELRNIAYRILEILLAAL